MGRAGAGAGPKPWRFPLASWRHLGFPAQSKRPGEFTISGVKHDTHETCTHTSLTEKNYSGEVCAVQNTPDPDQTLCALCASPGLIPSPVTVKDNFGNICRIILRVLA